MGEHRRLSALSRKGSPDALGIAESSYWPGVGEYSCRGSAEKMRRWRRGCAYDRMAGGRLLQSPAASPAPDPGTGAHCLSVGGWRADPRPAMGRGLGQRSQTCSKARMKLVPSPLCEVTSMVALWD